MSLRRALDKGYWLSGALAAVFLLIIFVIVFAQVLLNLLDGLVSVFGYAPMGLLLPSYADFAGFSFAAAAFLGLAHTFREGGHIRVVLFLTRLPTRLRKATELTCLAIALAVSMALSWRALLLMVDSLSFGDTSYGLVAIPIWIPQMGLVTGVGILSISLLDCFVTTLRGRPFGELPDIPDTADRTDLSSQAAE